MNKKLFSIFLSSSLLVQGIGLPVLANEFESLEEMEAASTQEMYRLYNRQTGEHFYTGDANEKDTLVKGGWRYEGIGWYAPSDSNTPVYRLYNQNSKDHHYTTNGTERDTLIRAGWKDEGISWYSDDSQRVPLYRQYNPNARTGNHNYTTNKGENDQLCRMGWKEEGIGWYAIKEGEPAPVEPEPTEVDYTAYYRPILDEAKRMVREKARGKYKYEAELEGIYNIMVLNGASLDEFGYTIKDLSGDGIPELAIVAIKYNENVVSLFTLSNNKPVNVFHGWERDRHWYAGGSSFIVNYSGGAYLGTLGRFSLSKDGQNIIYSELYLMEPNSSFSGGDVYSVSGGTRKYLGGIEITQQKGKEFDAMRQSLDLTPLSKWK